MEKKMFLICCSVKCQGIWRVCPFSFCDQVMSNKDWEHCLWCVSRAGTQRVHKIKNKKKNNHPMCT